MSRFAGILASSHVSSASNPLDDYSWAWRFESDSIVGLADADAVATWPDTSGNGRDATQTTPADRPTYRTGIYNGKPAVRFVDASEDRLVTGSITALPQPNTVFLVGSAQSTNGLKVLFDGININNRHYLDVGANGTDTQVFAGQGFNADTDIATAGIRCIRFDGTSSRLWNGGGASFAGNSGSHSVTGLTIGNRVTLPRGCGGDIAVLCLAPGAMALADINIIGDYLATTYGLTWSTAT